MLTKTNYIIWRDCHKNAWLKVHKLDIYFAHELSAFEQSIIETGNEVELLARELFPTGILIEEKGLNAITHTNKLLEAGEKTLFQPAFDIDSYFAAIDVLKISEDGKKCDIFEIKATNEIDRKTHFHDVAFQTILLKKHGFEVRSINLIHLNPEYVRDGEIDLNELFMIEDVTEVVEKMLPEVEAEMELALNYIDKKDEPNGPCDCVYKGRSSHCTTFSYSNPDIPKYGIHDLARIGLSKKKLFELVDGNKLTFEDVPGEMELSDTQKNQIWTYLYDKPIISKENINEELEQLVFPLYFLDYETFPSAIPRFNKYSPYQQIPFQYSLHVLNSPDSEPEHFDFLYTGTSDPSDEFVKSMQKHIGPKGSVIVWHKDFECGRNKELANRIPESKSFFDNLNERIYDLEIVFKKQHYVHKDFKGSSSIKKVLPVLAPTLSYKTLNIREGGSAANSWNVIVSGELSDKEKAQIAQDLKDYCKLDTYAMYAIWHELYKLVN